MPIALTAAQLRASDLNELSGGGGGGGGGGDRRTVDKLLDGTNATRDSNHMWLSAWQPETGRPHTLTVSLTEKRTVCALRVWNYNKSEDDALRGVRRVDIRLDGQMLSPPGGVELRKAPGRALFDHAQVLPLVLFPTPDGGAPPPVMPPSGFQPGMQPCTTRYAPLHQDYWAPVLPQAQLWQLRLLSTWGDVHYVGLDALQIFDEDGRLVSNGGARADDGSHRPARVYADPSDVNVLPEMSGDPRTVDKLFAPFPGAGGGFAGPWAEPPCGHKAQSDVWLAPWTPEGTHELWVCFEVPVALSLLRVLNYSKHPARGVQEFELVADGLLVYRGVLRRNGGGRGGDPTGGAAAAATTPAWQSVVLSDHPHVLENESVRLGRPDESDYTTLIDEGRIVRVGADASAPAPAPAAAVGAKQSGGGAAVRPLTSCLPGH
jgi:hypothetical protein